LQGLAFGFRLKQSGSLRGAEHRQNSVWKATRKESFGSMKIRTANFSVWRSFEPTSLDYLICSETSRNGLATTMVLIAVLPGNEIRQGPNPAVSG